MNETSDPRLTRIRAHISNFPKTPGVYLMKDRNGVVMYVGKARDLRARVASYFQPSADLMTARGPEIAHMASLVEDIDFIECESEVEALLSENRLIKDIQPAYNERLRDDKSFPYIEVTTSDEFPGVYVTRQPRPKGTKLFGPFVSAAGARDAVNALQKIFKYRTCDLDIRSDDDKRRFFRPCLLHSINQCTAPCADLIGKDAYREDIRRLIRLLQSKRSTLLRELNTEMTAAATDQRYEDAAVLRDRIKAIQSLALSGDVETDVQPEVFFIDPTEGLTKLGSLLGLPETPRIIEGIDIATLHGESSVGSLVCFIDGRPLKSGYRRFKIKTVEGVDDYAMIREVVARRYKHAASANELFPDVILIDGGLGQLHAALDAFDQLHSAIEAEVGAAYRPPMVISLAKREEVIYVQARAEPLRLARNNPALRLLQQVRDESHRFGQHYHHILRRKRTFEEDVSQGRRPPQKKGAAASSSRGAKRIKKASKSAGEKASAKRRSTRKPPPSDERQ